MRPQRKIGLVLLMMTLILAACGGGQSSNQTGSGSSTSEEKVKLTVWHNFAGDDLRAQTVRSFIDQFAAEHPEVTLDAQAIPTDGYRQRLSTVAAANEMPDVFLVYAGSQSAEFHQANLIQPITEILDAHPEWRDSFLDGAFDPYEFEEGQFYSAPIAMSATSMLFYNKALFEQHNVEVPTTWDELMTAINTFNDNGVTPIALGNKAPWVAQSTIIGAIADRVTGTDWFVNAVAQQGAKFTDPEFIEALGYFKQLVDNNAFQEGANSIDNTQAEQYFIQGNAAMMISGAWTLTNLAASATEEQMKDIEVTVVPAIPEGRGEANTITGGAGGGMALSSRTEGKAKELALELIYTMSGPEAQKAIAESNSMVMYDTEIDESKVTPLYYKAFNLVKSSGITPVYDAYLSAEAAEVINNGLQEIMMGGSVEEVAQRLQDAQARSATP
ncbi:MULTISPECIES: extracellular solute-binding protein [Paenibacillus]|uniref:Extracellular solute-binding protein n=1 Tax=Paenibacillus campinasensis TaxID=66347 RepID=A0ABW9SXS1_9BACL|nr:MULTISPECIES: extracellular solute-binding protein [Paenibacillus]MUG65247.1 extracellular solute-binding protein [Paenibacillus campinasensis]PAK52420.1 ABC transporter substrate-binding protein [Paenibacillus sp. 7541]